MKKTVRADRDSGKVTVPSGSEDDCPICTEPMKNDLTCPFCAFTCCDTCVKKFILGSVHEAECMSCKKIWDRETLVDVLGIAFVTGKYRKHYEKILLQTQKSKFEETQVLAAEYVRRKNDKIGQRIETMKTKRDNAKKAFDAILAKHDVPSSVSIHDYSIRYYLKRYLEENDVDKAMKLRDLYRSCSEKYIQLKGMTVESFLDNVVKNKKTLLSEPIPEFHGRCPQDNCNGFVIKETHKDQAPQYLCGICKTEVCGTCKENILNPLYLKPPKKKNASSENPDEHPGEGPSGSSPNESLSPDEGPSNEGPLVHRCNAQTLKTLRAIRRQTKPCPDCKVPVFRMWGCNLMWCTQCHASFDWEHGKKVRNKGHNPHYLEWKASQQASQRGPNGNPNELTEAGNVNQACIQVVDTTNIKDHMKQKFGKDKKGFIAQKWLTLGNFIRDVENNVLPRFTTDTDPFLVTRIKFLAGELSSHNFSREVYRIDKKVQKNRDKHNVLEFLINGVVDIVQQDLSEHAVWDNVLDFVDEINRTFVTVIRKYLNCPPRIMRDDRGFYLDISSR